MAIQASSTSLASLELSSLASHAAIQLDNRIQDISDSFDAVTELREFLVQALSEEDAPDGIAFAAPGTFEVFSQAIIKSRKDDNPLSTMQDLKTEAKDVLQQLGKESNLEEQRDFCSSLSLATCSYLDRRRISGIRHPYRR